MIRSDNLSKSLALVLVDMSEPWTIIESLEKWTSLINSFIDSLGTDPRKLKELEEKSMSITYQYKLCTFNTLFIRSYSCIRVSELYRPVRF